MEVGCQGTSEMPRPDVVESKTHRSRDAMIPNDFFIGFCGQRLW